MEKKGGLSRGPLSIRGQGGEEVQEGRKAREWTVCEQPSASDRKELVDRYPSSLAPWVGQTKDVFYTVCQRPPVELNPRC